VVCLSADSSQLVRLRNVSDWEVVAIAKARGRGMVILSLRGEGAGTQCFCSQSYFKVLVEEFH
jgi:hypothetical protein